MTGTSIKTLLAFALLVGVASQANADTWAHVDRQAADIERATKQLRTEVDHYRHTRQYGQLIGATARLKGQAIHVHNIARYSHSTVALKAAVKELDRAFHDAEYLFDQVEENAAYGEGRIRGNTAHVKQLLNGIDGCIDYLRADLQSLTRAQRVRTQYRPTPKVQSAKYGYGGGYGNYNRPAYNGGVDYNRNRNYNRGYNSGSRRNSISIGGGSSRITFRF